MIKNKITEIKKRIASVCSKIGRNPDSISLVCVTKGRSLEQIKEAIEGGITQIGENRVQEALYKINQLPTQHSELSTIKWHMVGHLQTNKVKEAVKIFDLIHSVDSFHLAVEIDKQAGRIDKIQDILMEIKTSPEATKFGIRADDAIEVIKNVAQLKNINIQGLMTIAPVVSNAQEARPYFRTLRELKDRINELRATSFELNILSMGMTDDFEVAIEEGANMVRLGRAIFEGKLNNK